MNNQVSVFTAFSPTFLHSLANLHCPSNKPLYVFPYGERMARDSLIQVSFKSNRNLIKKHLQNKHNSREGRSNIVQNFFITTPLHKGLFPRPARCHGIVHRTADGTNQSTLSSAWRNSLYIDILTCMSGIFGYTLSGRRIGYIITTGKYVFFSIKFANLPR